MKVTPLDLKKQEFKRAVRGYDRVEVDTFMELIISEFESLIHENTKLSKNNASLEAELKHFKEVEKTLKETLYNVQETSQISRENSLKEATLVKKEAELEAIRMVDEARGETQRLREEMMTLKQQKESFTARLRHLLSSQLELLEVLEMDDADLDKLKDKSGKTATAPKRPAPRRIKKSQPAPAVNDEIDEEKDFPVEQKKNDDFFKDVFGENFEDDEN